MPITGLTKFVNSKDLWTYTSTSDDFGVGTIAVDANGTYCVWIKNAEASTATAIGDALVQANATAYSLTLSPATADVPIVGFAAGVIAAGSYGWAYIYGPAYALVDGTTDVAVGAALSALATAKTIGAGDEQTCAIATVARTDNSAAVIAVFAKCI